MNNLAKIITIAASFLLGAGLTYLLLSNGIEHSKTASTATEQKPLYWVAPMDPSYRRDAPGKSPMGMDLVPFYETKQADAAAGTVFISPTVEQNMGVRTAVAQRTDLNLVINTIGFIQFNENRINHFHSRVDGWIESLSVSARGDKVNQGQKLYELYSPQLVNAQEEYLAALNSGNKQLLDGSAVKLGSLGVSGSFVKELNRNRKVQQRIPFYASQTGYISELNVREGSYIKPATNILSVGALEDVWTIAEIFERQANWIKEGQSVEMTIESFPEQKWTGVVDYLYPELEPGTRTLRARIVFNNDQLLLKPNMYAQLVIEGATRADVIAIPRQAVIYQGGMKRVVKSLGNGRFLSSRIETGTESGELIEVTSGLNAGEIIVISAQFMIDSESSLSADLTRIEAESDLKAADGIQASGELIQIMPGHNMINIQHEAIPEWGWPAMQMDFNTVESIDLDGFSPGQNVNFSLSETLDGGYIVTRLDPANNAMETHNSGEPTTAPMAGIWVEVEVVEFSAGKNQAVLKHPAIPEWGWPAMTMPFSLADQVDPALLIPAIRLRAYLTESKNGDYRVEQLKPVGNTTTTQPAETSHKHPG